MSHFFLVTLMFSDFCSDWYNRWRHPTYKVKTYNLTKKKEKYFYRIRKYKYLDYSLHSLVRTQRPLLFLEYPWLHPHPLQQVLQLGFFVCPQTGSQLWHLDQDSFGEQVVAENIIVGLNFQFSGFYFRFSATVIFDPINVCFK